MHSKTSTATVAGLSLCITAPNRTVKKIPFYSQKVQKRFELLGITACIFKPVLFPKVSTKG
jgi:hypothetical protein